MLPGMLTTIQIAPITNLLIGVSIIGPFPFTTSNSIPRAGRGVKISLNMMTPSGLKALHGCRDSSIAIPGVSDLTRNGYLSEYLQEFSWTISARSQSFLIDNGKQDFFCALALSSWLSASICLQQYKPHLRNSAIYLPACLISHTGVRSASVHPEPKRA